MPRLLYILPGLVPPDSDSRRDKFHYLSDICEGELLLPIWWSTADEVDAHLKDGFPKYRVGRFCYHLFLFHEPPRILRKVATFFWYISRGFQLNQENKIDVIMTYGTNLPALAGTILKWLTGAKLIVEVPGVPENAFRYDEPNQGNRERVKRFFANGLLYFVGRASDCLKLLYPWQLHKYPRLRKKKTAIFHDFVPVRCVQLTEQIDEFILCAGYPWYTKGVDILIRAFKAIVKYYPNYKLKLMGYYPDRQFLEELTEGCPQIEFLTARPHELALKVISSCSIYVLASRTEGMGRVLLEAMAAGKPIIASNVGGVPHYIINNENGLLFRSEDVEELVQKMLFLLNDKELQIRLARNGQERVFSQYDEFAYVRAFKKMLESIEIEHVSVRPRLNTKEASNEMSRR
jgi:glycosyltransferase involved in cell wall biosynthesis